MVKRIHVRMIISLLMCTVILFASVGYGVTHAWFSSTASNEPNLFVPVSGEIAGQCAELELSCYNFPESDAARQESLMAAVTGVTGNLNGEFLAWWRGNGAMDASVFEKTDYPATGQLIVKQYSYVNDTGSPVYVRMRPMLAGFDAAALGWVNDSAGAWSFDPFADAVLVYDDGYFYHEQPLGAYEGAVITFAFYSLAVSPQSVLAVSLTLEGIQAGNNAPYLSPDWKGPFGGGADSYANAWLTFTMNIGSAFGIEVPDAFFGAAFAGVSFDAPDTSGAQADAFSNEDDLLFAGNNNALFINALSGGDVAVNVPDETAPLGVGGIDADTDSLQEVFAGNDADPEAQEPEKIVAVLVDDADSGAGEAFAAGNAIFSGAGVGVDVDDAGEKPEDSVGNAAVLSTEEDLD